MTGLLQNEGCKAQSPVLVCSIPVQVVNDPRFLILPWIHMRGLASKILSLCARQLPRDRGSNAAVKP